MIALRKILRPALLTCALVSAVWLALPKPPLLDGIPFSQCVRDRNGKLLRLTLSTDQKFRILTPLQKISPDLINATLSYEDKYYARHPGVNPIALARCAIELIRFHRATAGGSTITMQVARLRFHLHTRNVSGKLEQILRALELERHYSKNEILEAYLNLGLIYKEAGDYARARANLEKYLARASASGNAETIEKVKRELAEVIQLQEPRR